MLGFFWEFRLSVAPKIVREFAFEHFSSGPCQLDSREASLSVRFERDAERTSLDVNPIIPTRAARSHGRSDSRGGRSRSAGERLGFDAPLESPYADMAVGDDLDEIDVRASAGGEGGAVLYLVLLGTNFGLAAAALTTAGMALSVWSQNSYVAIGGSVLLFYFLYSVSLLLPDRVSFEWISSGLQSLPSENPIWVAVYHLGFLLICNVFSGLFFYYAVRKRYQNGDL